MSGIDTAVIMAGGQGMRLRPYTTVLPKPLMPLGDRPLLEILIRRLAASGVRRVFLSVNHLAHILRSVLEQIEFGEMEIIYCYEDEPLGTCGALTLMRNDLPERFLVVNGDLLSDYPIRSLVEAHVNSDAGLSIATRRKSQPVSFGVIQRCPDGSVSDYIEKPSREYEQSIGLYALERRVVENELRKGAYADMPDLIRTILANGGKVCAVPHDCLWIDIGHPEDYLNAQALFEEDPKLFLPEQASVFGRGRP